LPDTLLLHAPLDTDAKDVVSGVAATLSGRLAFGGAGMSNRSAAFANPSAANGATANSAQLAKWLTPRLTSAGLTVALWVKISDSSDPQEFIFALAGHNRQGDLKLAAVNVTGKHKLSATYLTYTQTPTFNGHVASPGNQFAPHVGCKRLIPHAWTHVAVTLAESARDAVLCAYLNGVQCANATQTSIVGSVRALTSLTVGSNSDGTSNLLPSGQWSSGYSGSVDDVRVYGSVLTPGQVARLFDDYFPSG
jgi:hypothetical protein